jgi:hypothetical protein
VTDSRGNAPAARRGGKRNWKGNRLGHGSAMGSALVYGRGQRVRFPKEKETSGGRRFRNRNRRQSENRGQPPGTENKENGKWSITGTREKEQNNNGSGGDRLGMDGKRQRTSITPSAQSRSRRIFCLCRGRSGRVTEVSQENGECEHGVYVPQRGLWVACPKGLIAGGCFGGEAFGSACLLQALLRRGTCLKEGLQP